MTPTTDLLQEVLTDLYKRKSQYEETLKDINEKITSHEAVIKLIENEKHK